MSLKKWIYIKKQQLNRFLAVNLGRQRTQSTLQIIIKTLKANNYLPDKLIALEVFGFIGTSTAQDYIHLTAYFEIWELDPYYAKWAKKLNKSAIIMNGDSVEALKKGYMKRNDYNFVVIDPNIYTGNSFESFDVFENTLKYIDRENCIIIVTIYNNIQILADMYCTKLQDFDPWLKARSAFFNMNNVINARGDDYLDAFSKIIIQNKLEVISCSFLSRNDAVGFGVFVI